MIRTKINILQLFHAVVNRINVDYAALFGWDFNNCNVTVRGMLIPDALLTKEIHATDDYKEYETMFINVAVLMNQPQPVVEGEKDEESYADKFVASMIHDDDFGDRIDPESHKGHPEVVVVDDDDNKEEKKYEKKDDEMGSLENGTEKMQTPIPTTPRSPRINLLSDKNIAQELMDTKVHGKVDQVLHEIIAQLAERATNDLIEGNLKRVVADTVIQERDAFQTDNNVIQVHPTTSTSNETTSLADLQQQSYSKIKDDAFHSQRHDDHQEDVAPPKGEKRVKRHKTSKSSKSTRGSSLKQSAKDSTFYVTKQQQQQEWDAWEEETVVDKDEIISKD
ncbi:hypothetical protein Tco_0417766 [Tanacetum coccineum]